MYENHTLISRNITLPIGIFPRNNVFQALNYIKV